MKKVALLLLILLGVSASMLAQDTSDQVLIFSSQDTLAASAESYTAEVRVSNFNLIVGAQFTFQWDSSVLAFQQVESFADFLGLDDHFGRNNVENGLINFAWLDLSLGGLSLPDSTLLFSVTYDVIGEPGSSSPIAFGDSPTAREVYDTSFEVISSQFIDGAAFIEGNTVNTVQNDPSQLNIAKLSPNPAIHENIQAELFLKSATPLNWRLVGLNGQIIYQQNQYFTAGNHNIELDRSLFPKAGIYILYITSEQFISSRKIVIQQQRKHNILSSQFPRIMKKTLTILLLGLVVLPMILIVPSHAAGFPPSMLAAEGRVESDPSDESLTGDPTPLMDFTLTASSDSVTANEDFCVSLSVANFTNILGMEYVLTYDPAQLQFDTIQNLNLTGLNQSAFGRPGEGANALGELKVSWFDSQVSGITVVDGTVIFEVCFRAITDNVTSTIGFQNPEIIDINENVIAFVGETADIVVGTGGDGSSNNGNTGNNSNGFTISIGDGTVSQGQQVCLPVSVDGFDDILGVELLFTHDPAKFQFNMVQALDLVGLNSSAFGEPGVGANPNNQLKLSWFDQTVSGVSVADGTVIFEICYTALTNNTTGSVTMSGAEIIDSGENVIPFNGNNATITVGAGSGGSGSGTGDFMLTVSDEMTEQGQEVCASVSVEGFTDILGIEVVFDFDPTKLQYSEVKNFNLSGLNSSAFGEPGVGANPNNQLKLSWFDQQVAGVTVSDNTTIFDVCFNAKGDNTTDQITMSNSEIIDANEEEVSFSGNPGTITIGDSGNNNGGGNTGGSTDFTIQVTDTTTQQGQEVCLPITVANFTDILGIEVVFDFDPTKLQYSEVKNFNLTGLNASAFGEPGVGANPNNQLKLSWFDQQVAGVTLSDDTPIFELCFTALGNNTTDQINMSQAEIINSNEDVIPFNGVSGTVTIGDSQTGGGNDPVEITMSNATVEPSDNFCLGVTVNDFTDLSGLEFTIDYDPQQLTFVEVKDFNLPDLTSAAFGVPGQGSNMPGSIAFSWFDTGGNGVSVNNGTVIFETCFQAGGSNGTSSVSFTETEVIDQNNTIVTPTLNAGTVTIQGMNTGSQDLTISVGDATVQAGDVICLPIQVDNFIDVLGMEYTINYDPTVFEFVEVKDFNLTDLNASSFGLPGVGANQEGDLKLSWFDQAAAGISLPNGTTIFNVCLRAIGSGSSTVSINTNGLEVTNADELPIIPVLESGNVTISGIAPTSDLQIIFGNETVAENEQVCVEVTTNNFENVLGLEFVMEYDPALLEFDTVQNLNLNQLTISSFGLPGVGVNVPGEIKLSWFDQQVAGVDLPDGTVLFELCFTAVASSGSSTIDLDLTKPVEITDANENPIVYQQVPGSVVISSAPALELASPAVVTGVSCFGDTNGAIDISIQGGSNTYTYLWSANDATTEDLSGLVPGAYTVTVTDANTSQVFIETFTIPAAPAAISIDNRVTTDILCRGESTGAIQLDVSGGTAPLSLTWSNGLGSSTTLGSLSAGTYTLTVTDANSCVDTAILTITEPDVALEISTNITPESCAGQGDGAIDITVSGGVGSYTYNWGNGLIATQEDHTNLSAGDYPVTITDANGCTITSTVQVASNPAVEINNLQANFINQGADGSINLSASGGASPYSYTWTGPSGFSDNGANLSGLATVGEYCVTITDANGCIATDCVMLLERLSFSGISILNTCSGSPTGSVDVEISGGMAPYTYSWNNGETTQDLMDVGAGTYSLTVTDDLGNSFNGQFPVGSFNPIFSNGNVTNVSGADDATNGGITLNVSGGNPGYTYQWNNGATTPNIINLAAGEYCVTITDQNNCTVEECFDVEVQILPLGFNAEKTDNTCNGDQAGTATIIIRGGASPYAISFSDDVTQSTTDGIISRSNLPGGQLDFVITDANNETIQGGVTILEPSPITTSSLLVKHDIDAPGCTGEINISLSGGTPGYEVSWNSPNTGTSIIGLCEGNYVPTIRDANGCVTTLEPIFVNTFFIDNQVTEAECRDDENGRVVILPTGGSGDYTYNWENAAGDPISDSSGIDGVAAGTYFVTITESSGNTITESFEVGVRSQLTATATVTSDFQGFGVSCPGNNDGVLSATAQNGAGNYTYSWMQGDNLIGEGIMLNGVAEGLYTLEVTDDAGCTVMESASVIAASPISTSGFVNDLSCVGERDGSITVVASGGVGGFSYNWSNTAASPNLSSLARGNYALTVTDANGCTAETSFDVSEPTPIQVTIETTPATDGCNGVARAVVNGGAGPFLYRWNSNAVNTDSVLTNLCPGDYAVVVTDARGCTSSPNLAQAAVLDRRFPCMDIRSVISPDGDGLNDEFFINCIEEMNDNELMIFNRWGQMVFEATNYSNDWNGVTMNGERLPDGAYYYILEFTDNEGNRVQTKGSISLLRE